MRTSDARQLFETFIRPRIVKEYEDWLAAEFRRVNANLYDDPVAASMGIRFWNDPYPYD